MARVVLVFVFGGLGSVARFGVATMLQRFQLLGFPLGTLAVNLLGSLLMALITDLALRAAALSPDARIVLATGFCGGFTTYSAFNQETLALAQAGSWGPALAYVLCTVVGCLTMGALGLAVGRALA